MKTVINSHEFSYTMPVVHCCYLPLVLRMRVMSGALMGTSVLGKGRWEALNPVCVSSGERKEGNMANWEMCDA